MTKIVCAVEAHDALGECCLWCPASRLVWWLDIRKPCLQSYDPASRKHRIYPLPGRPSGVTHIIAIKQLYASHYFHTTLELRFLVDDERRADRRGFSLLSITRSRVDGTSGLAGSLLRPVISRRSRTAVRGYLEHLKRQIEGADPAPF